MFKFVSEEIGFYSSIPLFSGLAGPQGEPGVAGKQLFQYFFPFVCTVDTRDLFFNQRWHSHIQFFVSGYMETLNLFFVVRQ